MSQMRFPFSSTLILTLILPLMLPVIISGQEDDLPLEPYARGIALLERGRYAEARDQFDSLLQQDPSRQDVLYNKGMSQLGLKNPDAAWADFSRMASVNPSSAMAQVGLAKVWTERLQYSEAMNALAKAFSLDPACVEAHYQKGIVLGWQKQTDIALESFKKAVELKPDHAYSYYQLGLIYNQMQRKDLAITHLERFLALSPRAPEAEQVRNLLGFIRR